MVDLMSLWLPILLSTIALFFLSFLAWAVTPLHKADWVGLPDESAFSKALRGLNIPPGSYMFPYCGSNAEMKSAAFKQRTEEGPLGTITVWGGPCNMPVNLVCQILYFLVTSFCLAYLATLGGIEPGAEFMKVFRFVGTAAILTYTAANVPSTIWFKVKLTGYIVEGIAYGLATGAIFAWLWPGA